jgi:hypothetical protein
MYSDASQPMHGMRLSRVLSSGGEDLEMFLVEGEARQYESNGCAMALTLHRRRESS